MTSQHLEHLRDREWIFTFGGEISDSRVAKRPPWAIDLAARLADWADLGGIGPLFAILQPRGTCVDHRADCFGGKLLEWIADIGTDAESFADFSAFADFPATSTQPLFELLLVLNEHLVLWRLSQIVAVA